MDIFVCICTFYIGLFKIEINYKRSVHTFTRPFKNFPLAGYIENLTPRKVTRRVLHSLNFIRTFPWRKFTAAS